MNSRKIAASALLSALGTVLLYFSGTVQTGAIALCAAAGIMPALAYKSEGGYYGWMSYACITILGWILIPNKIYAAVFTFCFGIYPTLKFYFEKINLTAAQWAAKLAYANAVFFVIYKFFGAVFSMYLMKLNNNYIIFALLFNIIFVVYDLGISQFMSFYARRIEKNIK